MRAEELKAGKLPQHVGFGRRLMEDAEDIAAAAGYSRLAVIAGIGTRNYYRKLGYEVEWYDCPVKTLDQINRSNRDILQEKYNACLDPNCSAQTRSVFIRVLKRIAESFMSCLLSMSTKR